MEKTYSIQEVSQLLQLPKDTLRYYDRMGIVSPSRKENRYRRYTKNDLIDLMNVQIMQYADFALEEIKGKFQFHRMEHISPADCQEVASFLDAKNAETRQKIEHLEKISQLLHTAAETLRDFNPESDQRLAETVREIYQSIRGKGPVHFEEGCNGHQD
ncbi:MAG: MerR family transcriptional regulator [Paenibacillaceae bacterium]|nr:MerR family transcriptional regulator [Paenibacillaceae bacterium]